MPKRIRLIAVIVVSCVGIAACATTGAQTTPTSTPDCVGLSICAPPPPDAEGNLACYYSDGWQATGSGAGIEVWYFHEPQNLSKPEAITAVVRKKDGTNESQGANIEAGQQTHRFEFPNVDKSTVQEVLLSTGSGRCFVAGPTS
ncbi:MAG: hypothetical protein WCB92_22700 [Mycobacterium sp.]